MMKKRRLQKGQTGQLNFIASDDLRFQDIDVYLAFVRQTWLMNF